MTTPVLKLKIFPKPVIKGKMDVRFPAKVVGGTAIEVAKANGTYTFDIDFSEIQQFTSVPVDALGTTHVLTWNDAEDSYALIPWDLAASSPQDREVTAAGDVTITEFDGIVRINKTVGAATNVVLPAASGKTGQVLIVDWKNDAATNNITLTPNGSEKIQGLSSWVIAGDGASILLRPISGVGWVI